MKFSMIISDDGYCRLDEHNTFKCKDDLKLPSDVSEDVTSILKYVSSGKNVLLCGTNSILKTDILKRVSCSVQHLSICHRLVGGDPTYARNLCAQSLVDSTGFYDFQYGDSKKLYSLIRPKRRQRGSNEFWDEMKILIIDGLHRVSHFVLGKLNMLLQKRRQNKLYMGGVNIIASVDFRAPALYSEKKLLYTYKEFKNAHFIRAYVENMNTPLHNDLESNYIPESIFQKTYLNYIENVSDETLKPIVHIVPSLFSKKTHVLKLRKERINTMRYFPALYTLDESDEKEYRVERNTARQWIENVDSEDISPYRNELLVRFPITHLSLFKGSCVIVYGEGVDIYTVKDWKGDCIILQKEGVEKTISKVHNKYQMGEYGTIDIYQYPLISVDVLTIDEIEGLILPHIQFSCEYYTKYGQLYSILSRVTDISHVTTLDRTYTAPPMTKREKDNVTFIRSSFNDDISRNIMKDELELFCKKRLEVTTQSIKRKQKSFDEIFGSLKKIKGL